MKVSNGKKIVCTYKNTAIDCDNTTNLTSISPTFHDEADARLLLHAWHASTIEGHSKVIIKTVDSDVVVIALYAFPRMSNVVQL